MEIVKTDIDSARNIFCVLTIANTATVQDMKITSDNVDVTEFELLLTKHVNRS
jgi:hypothetical protein